MKGVVAAFNQEKALVGAFSVITDLRMELFEALYPISYPTMASSISKLQVVEVMMDIEQVWFPTDVPSQLWEEAA